MRLKAWACSYDKDKTILVHWSPASPNVRALALEITDRLVFDGIDLASPRDEQLKDELAEITPLKASGRLVWLILSPETIKHFPTLCDEE
jgi:hypothetical protein